MSNRRPRRRKDDSVVWSLRLSVGRLPFPGSVDVRIRPDPLATARPQGFRPYHIRPRPTRPPSPSAYSPPLRSPADPRPVTMARGLKLGVESAPTPSKLWRRGGVSFDSPGGTRASPGPSLVAHLGWVNVGGRRSCPETSKHDSRSHPEVTRPPGSLPAPRPGAGPAVPDGPR